MKRFFVSLALAVLGACGYQLISLPTYGTSFWQAIHRQVLNQNESVIWYLAGFAIAALALVIAALEKGKTFTQEQRLDHIWKLIREQTPFVERMEGKFAEASRLKDDLTRLRARTQILINSGEGLASLVRQVESLHVDLKRDLDDFTRGKDGGDLLNMLDELSSSYISTDTRFVKLESHVAGLPAMKMEVERMIERVAVLSNKKEGVVVQLVTLRALLDSLTDDDYNGTLDEIECGDPEGGEHDLEEQIGNLGAKIDDIKVRMTAIDKLVLKLGQVRKDLAALGLEPHPTNVVPGPGSTAVR